MMQGSLAAVISVVALGASAAQAQQSKVRLTTDRAVYKKGDPKGVTFTLKNEGSVGVVINNQVPWSIWMGDGEGMWVYMPLILMNPRILGPGKSESWTWNMKDDDWKLVPSGTYTIRVGSLWIGNKGFTVDKTIAITKSGKLGTNLFPLAAGNEWTYVSGPGLGGVPSVGLTTQVIHKLGSWYWVTNLLGGDWYAKSIGWSYPYLAVAYAEGSSTALFKFKRPLGYSYQGLVPPLLGKTIKVGATKATLNTPLGTFQNCYRLDVVSEVQMGYKSFWFAPGVGLVGYDKYTPNEVVAYRLHTAKVKGSDGKVYAISADH